MRLGLLLASVAILAACNMSANAQRNDTAASAATQRGYEVGAFHAVSLGGPHDMIVTVGGAPSVRAEGSAETLDQMEILVENGTLIVRDKSKNWNWGKHDRPATLHVTVPSLDAAALGGSGNIRIDKVSGSSFKAALGGSGNIEIGALSVGSADFSVAGSGNIKAGGKADSTSTSIAGSGNVEIDGLDSKTASVSIVGSGNAGIRASADAAVSIMGSGDVSVAGGGKCTVKKMGSGDVKCGG